MDYIVEAQEVIKQLDRDPRNNIKLSTSQIRKFLSAINIINNKLMVLEAKRNMEELDKNDLPQELRGEIRYLEVKLLYQAGREAAVRNFLEKATLQKRIQLAANGIREYKEFANFMEAIVAFHKFEGGRD